MCSGLWQVVSISGVCGALTSRSRPSSPLGWSAAQGRCGSCAGSGQSAARRSTAASCGWVCCIQGRRSPTDTEPHAHSTAAAPRLQSETKQQFSLAVWPCALFTDLTSVYLKYSHYLTLVCKQKPGFFFQLRALRETRPNSFCRFVLKPDQLVM